MFGVLSWIPKSIEFPLGSLVGIAVDPAGQIYCGTQFYGRIQKYAADGRFLAGWFINSAGGVFRLRVNADGQLEVATARNDTLYRFSQSGELLSQTRNEDAFEDFGPEGERRWTTEGGTVFEIDHTLLLPSISRRNPSGEKETVVRTPLHKWFLMGPFPAWLFFAVGGLVLAGLDGRLRLKRRVEV